MYPRCLKMCLPAMHSTLGRGAVMAHVVFTSGESTSHTALGLFLMSASARHSFAHRSRQTGSQLCAPRIYIIPIARFYDLLLAMSETSFGHPDGLVATEFFGRGHAFVNG